MRGDVSADFLKVCKTKKTELGGTDDVWFYDMQADGFSLDDKRTPVSESDILEIRNEEGCVTGSIGHGLAA